MSVRPHYHDRAAPAWHVAGGLALLVLLTTLGTLQYRWLGEVSDAARARMRDNLQTRANDCATEFDRELTRTYLAFHVQAEAFDRDPAKTIAAAFAAAQNSGATRVVRELFLLQAAPSHATSLQRFDPAAGTLRGVEWPPALQKWRERTELTTPHLMGSVSPLFLTEAVDAATPALVIPVPKVRRIESEGQFAVLPDPGGAARAILVWLDAAALESQLLRPLVAKYFGPAGASDYVVTIVHRDDPAQAVFTSASPGDTNAADATAGMFDLRIDEVNRVAAGLGIALPPASADATGRTATDKVAITIVRRANAPDGARVLMAGGDRRGAWQLRVGHRSGSLEAIVGQSRRRNLAIGLGVLGLLGASFILVIAAARRQQRLARQQMEFVAAVSHELRTPLAVICSAGENLADGVVADTQQVKRYGSLIETEGRRLGDMVERVLQFAGITSGTQTMARVEVDVAQVVADAVRAVSAEARERGVEVAVRAGGALPPVVGDADALRSAVQNVIGNAVKYSTRGGAVDVMTDVLHGAILQIRVADCGIGIDDEDLANIFKPFYRGRRAVDAQVRGSGIGLSVVQNVVRRHGGDVAVESRAGEGTTVTIVLPAGPAAASPEGRRRVILRHRVKQAAARS